MIMKLSETFTLFWNEIYKNTDSKLYIDPMSQNNDIHIQKNDNIHNAALL